MNKETDNIRITILAILERITKLEEVALKTKDQILTTLELLENHIKKNH